MHPTRITLRPDEIEIAHSSFTDESISNHEKERRYADNKRKMLEMRRNGSLNE
jgi:hypothetical protein